MSGIAVVLQRDGAPADTAALGRMLARLAHRGPDGEDAVVAGPLALGHRRFWTTPEEVGERQPFTDPTGRYWIACDGRIDNREELLPALAFAVANAASTSDTAVLLEAFVRWGVSGFARVVGSFAAAIWDTVDRRLTLVRDALGDRTLCYALLPAAVVAASEEQAVLAHPGVSASLDERRLAQFFALSELDSDATFFAAIKEVLPGHAVVFEGGGQRSVRYWELAPASPLRVANDHEAAEAFAERLDAAVRARLRSTAPIALMLSGGLDSTAIAGTAAAIAPRTAIKAVSWVFDELLGCDERTWIDPVVRRCGLEPLQFAADGEWPFRELAGRRGNPNSPEDDLYRRLVERARSLARAAGCRVVLSGMFGDHLYGGTHGWLWERLARGEVSGALAGIGRVLLGTGRVPLLRAALLPRRAPAPVHALRRAFVRPRRWLTSHAAELIVSPSRWPAAADAALRPAQCRSVLGLLGAHGVSGETFHASSAGVEARYPFRDRRVVELALRLPSEQLRRPGTTRPVLREAMRGRLPDEVRGRVGKTSLAPLFRRAIADRERGAIAAMVAAGRNAWEPFVRPEWVAAAMHGGIGGAIEALAFCHCALLGQWLDKHS